jgi:ADP-ribose pyrophosphatase YjhB (NUDIX family)
MSSSSGEQELGDTIEDRIRKEIAEETNATLRTSRFLFVVENRFIAAGQRIHTLELYVEATIDRKDVHSREPHLKQEWLPLDTLASVDLRPYVVRDALADGSYETVGHLVVDGWR